MSTPVIVTASWYTILPAGYARIGISRGTPRGQRGYRMYRALAPGPWFRSVEPAEFCRLYMAQLNELKPQQVVDELTALADGKIPAVLCFERPPPDPHWCHRSLVSAWLADELAIEVPEFGHWQGRFGWHHPKLYACHTRQA